MRLFEIDFIEYSGEQEYRNTKLMFAETQQEVETRVKEWLKNWYEDFDEDSDIDEGEFSFCGGCLIVKLQGIYAINKDEWLQEQFALALIGDDYS